MSIKNLIKIFFLLPAILLISCGKEEQTAKSMEEIRRDEGIPVKVQALETKAFVKYYSFYSKLCGTKEATKGALVGGRIEKINVRVGDNVAKDQVIVEFDEYNPGLQYDQAKAAYVNSEKTYHRLKSLLEEGETSQANYDGAETQYLVAKRNYESLKQVLFVESPFAGTIVDIKVNEGDNVKNEAHLFTVAQLHKMRAKVWASESEISMINKGMKAEMNYNGKLFTGKVVDVSLAADPFKQAFYAEVEFDNPDRELKSGTVVDIKILIYNNPGAIVIPRSLVMQDEKGAYIYVEKNNSAEIRYIKNGNDSGLDCEITKGLHIGDKLIVQGAAQLNNGSKVKVIQ